MATELELKLSLRQPALFLRQPLLRQAQWLGRQQLHNIYFDTPTLALQRRGIALRLRRQGRRWLQTVKCSGAGAAGLSSRPEWETPYGGAFDFSAVSDPEVRRWLSRPALQAQLQPCFTTHFQRSSWRLSERPLGTPSSLLLVLDRGHISVGERHERILELELELEHGAVDHLFATALALAAQQALLPLSASKAQRGYALAAAVNAASGTSARSAASRASTQRRKPQALAPDADWRLTLLACVEQLVALQADDPAAPEALRTALRSPAYSRLLLRLCALGHIVTLA